MIDRVSKPEEQSVDSDYQTDKVWLLIVQGKLYQWSLENAHTRLHSNHWRAGGIAKGAYPVRREVRENRRQTPHGVSDLLLPYIPTLEGWLYVVVILDVFSRQVVGWGMSDRLTAEFVIRALSQAIGGRRPSSGLIVHSDRGIQYACAAFKDVLSQYGFRQSMSRKGDCYDNALAESFFHTLKTVHVDFHR